MTVERLGPNFSIVTQDEYIEPKKNMKRKAAQNISKYNIPANATQGFNIEVNCLWGEHIADKEWYDRPRPQSRFSL